MAEIDEKYLKPENYVNREMSWLEFDFRILGEARDKSIPLFERLKFLSITSSNLDEFFMVRVASLKDMVHAKYKKPDIAGLRADRQLELFRRVQVMGQILHDVFRQRLRLPRPGAAHGGTYIRRQVPVGFDTQAADRFLDLRR